MYILIAKPAKIKLVNTLTEWLKNKKTAEKEAEKLEKQGYTILGIYKK